MKLAKNYNLYLFLTVFVMGLCLISLVIFTPRPSLEFTGGSAITYTALNDQENARNLLETAYQENNINITQLIQNGAQFSTRSRELKQGDIESILSKLNNPDLRFAVSSVETLGASLSSSLIKNSVKAVVLALLGILIYLAYSFKDMPKPYSSLKIGISTIIAMIHDVLVVLAVFGITSRFFGYELDLMFVTALLTVLGFSVNDTIVVFDRVRENLLRRGHYTDYSVVLDTSIRETLRRSLFTSGLVLLVLIFLFFFGALQTRSLVFTLLIGIVIGTYSSIFVATPLLYVLEKKFVWQKKLR